MTFSTFLERGLRIRTDLYSTFLSTPALLILLSERLRVFPLMVAGFFLGLAFISTQKAAYFVIAFAVALTGRIILENGLKSATLKPFILFGASSAIGFFIPVLGLMGLMAHWNSLDAFIQQCFFYAFEVGLVADSYAYTTTFLVQSLTRNMGFYAMGLAGMGVLLLEGLTRREVNALPGQEQRSYKLVLGLWTFTMIFLVLRHTVKFPYIYLTLSPCLAMSGGVLLARVTEKAFSAQFDWRQLSLLALGLMF